MSVCFAKSTNSLKLIFFWMILIAGLSSLVTYHIGLLLPWVEVTQSVTYVGGQISIKSVLVNELRSEKSAVSDDRNQHPYRKLSQASDPKLPNPQISQILAKLKQVEARIQSLAAYRTVLSLGLDTNQTEILKKVFSSQNYTVFSADRHNGDTRGNWSVIWTSEHTKAVAKQDYQKLNHIPVLQHVIQHTGYICHLHRIYSKITDIYNTSCYDSPSEIHHSSLSTLFLFDEKEALKPVHGTEELLSEYRDGIWQTNKENLLKLNGHILRLQLSIFVASLFPLRLYIHSGPVLEKVKLDMFEQYGEKLESLWWKTLKESIIISLLTTENLSLRLDNLLQLYQCHRCTQLVEFEVMFTSRFNPIIVKVNPKYLSTNLDVLKDIATLMVPKETLAVDIAATLGESSTSILLGEKGCRQSFGICLLETDVIYLLENAHESKTSSSFIKLYPSTSDDYTSIINSLKQLWINDRSFTNLNQKIFHHVKHIPEIHSTPDVHSLLHQVESYISTNVDYTEEDLLSSNLLSNMNIHRHLKSSDQKDYISLDEQGDLLCSKDPEDLLLLNNLKTYPDIALKFYPYQFTYDIIVDYDTILVQLNTNAKGCLTEARFDNITGLVNQCNYTLGLGDNAIKIHIVDLSNRQPVIINTYTLNINRKYPGLDNENLPKIVLNTCVLKQDCSLKYSPDETCGLQTSKQYGNWNQFIAESNRKPYCNSYTDLANADWKVPCMSCDDRNSCYWKQARWQPFSCQQKQHSFTDIKHCFKGKKLLFLGDSTNRGIMHYIVEKINGTLLNWDKTHDLKLYNNINGKQTTMSFSYYPQFWLPNNHRPGFDKAIYQLIKWTSPLENNSNTVLVVGGVHWLGKQHINIILSALKREGLTGIRLVMKGHGAGFHQHVEGVHYASLAHQQKLELQEREVSRFAASHGFLVVPTFNMTMSRYKDFLQGKCACHFHKVSMKTNGQGSKNYHIEGEINAAYSDLVINAICQRHPG